MPILKQFVSNSNQSKRRSRADLTAEMISAPLGDFRHTMHVGRGGDAFGDTSFLSTRSGEPPREANTAPPDHPNKQDSPGGGGGGGGVVGSKPGLLSRTFRSSKRTQSVNRGGDKYDSNLILPSSTGAASYVKNAISLPYLNDEDTGRGVRLAKSVSSSPMRKPSELDGGGGGGHKPANGGGAMAAMATLDAEFDEHNFGELTDLPPSVPRGGGMKHAESIMSFHIDLGPSMLGDILSVMEKKGWEDDDLGYEEGKGSEGRGSPSLSPPTEDEDTSPPARPPRSMVYQQQQQKTPVDPYTPELRVRSTAHNNQSQYLDSCSVSSSGSAALDDQKALQHHNNNHNHHLHREEGDTDSAKYSSPRGEEDRDFSFMDEDDDEIRV